MADEDGKEKLETLKRIAAALEGINSKLEKVVKQRRHANVSGPNADYWVLVTEPHEYGVK
jgi:hypothetical protein